MTRQNSSTDCFCEGPNETYPEGFRCPNHHNAPAVTVLSSKDAAIHANFELAEELRKAIFDIELMIELNQVTDGPRNDKERAEQAERHALVGRLAKIRRALYRSKDLIENLEA